MSERDFDFYFEIFGSVVIYPFDFSLNKLFIKIRVFWNKAKPRKND